MKIPVFLRRFFPLICAIPLLCTGCAGYHLGSSVPKRMKGIQTIAVPTFHNATLIPRLEALAAGTVVSELQKDGTFRVTSEKEADVILSGTVENIRRRGQRSVRGDVVMQQEYLLSVTFSYTIERRVGGEQIDSGSLVGQTSFFVSGNDVNQDERQAIPLAIEKAAVRLVNKISSGW